MTSEQEQFWPAVNYTVVTEALVDGEPWVTVSVSNDIAKWVRKQSKKNWYEHSGNVILFDMPETLYTLLRLAWPR